VDNFAVAWVGFKTTQAIVAAINNHVTTDDMGMGVIPKDCTFSRYNRLDIYQTRAYIKISCENYID